MLTKGVVTGKLKADLKNLDGFATVTINILEQIKLCLDRRKALECLGNQYKIDTNTC